MAQDDVYTNCDNKEQGIEQLIRQMIYEDENGNPILHTDTNGTELEPYFNCTERKEMSLDQVFKLMVLEDANGNPYLNTTS
jgi:hypothetical protein